jgi:predicted nuclease of predicted toxin-antitoxin system
VAAEITFHLDECVPAAVADGLRRRGIEVSTTWESGLAHSLDTVQLDFSSQSERVLVTQDADFLRLHRSGITHSGIVYYEPGTLTVGQLIQGLVLIHGVMTPDEMRNHLEFL